MSKFITATLLLVLVFPVASLVALSSSAVPVVKAGGEEVPVSSPVLPVTSPVLPTPTPGSNGSNQGNGSNGGSNTGTSAPTTPSCGDVRPAGQVDLFQIDRNGSKATLYFTPVTNSVSHYNVIFGFKDGDERFGGLSLPATNNQGVQSLTIDNLAPNKTYSFKVAPVNGCAVGDWSNWLSAKGKKSKYFRYFLGR
jgi:hypothetical protein